MAIIATTATMMSMVQLSSLAPSDNGRRRACGFTIQNDDTPDRVGHVRP
jgi:hypothetical protein